MQLIENQLIPLIEEAIEEVDISDVIESAIQNSINRSSIRRVINAMNFEIDFKFPKIRKSVRKKQFDSYKCIRVDVYKNQILRKKEQERKNFSPEKVADAVHKILQEIERQYVRRDH